MLLDVIHDNKETILRIAQQHNANNVRVFGSVVRGEEKENSDIDLLVSFQPGASLLDQVGLMNELREILGKKVDVISDRALNPYIRDKILKEAQPIWKIVVCILTIRDCIQRIKEYTIGYDKDTFLKDHKTQDAVIRNIEVIGQAVKDYGVADLLHDFPEVPWLQIAGMRNIIAHEYLGIDMIITWEVVDAQIDSLEHAISKKVTMIGDIEEK